MRPALITPVPVQLRSLFTHEMRTASFHHVTANTHVRSKKNLHVHLRDQEHIREVGEALRRDGWAVACIWGHLEQSDRLKVNGAVVGAIW